MVMYNTKQKNNLIKHCRVCNNELVVGSNWTKTMKKHGKYTYKKCYNEQSIKYREQTSPSYKKGNKYSLTKHCRDCGCQLIPNNNWLLSHQKYHKYICKNCYYKYEEKFTLQRKSWINVNPDRVKEYNRVSKAKRKGYDSIFLFDNPFPPEIPVVGHHISDGFMVYLPESLHLNHLHGKYTKLHRDELQPFVESIYNISYIIM